MMADLEKQRHAAERGDLLRTLKEDYTAEMTSTRSLLRALDAQPCRPDLLIIDALSLPEDEEQARAQRVLVHG
ncbi:hypothetical protein LCGC14_1330340, partial [marine sediment metagenome]